MQSQVFESQWMRSQNGWVAGVCEGLAESFDFPVFWVRLAWGLSLFMGFGFLLYIVAAFCVPERGSEVVKKKFLGVCYRLSKSLNFDLSFIRIGMVFGALSTLGTTLLLYLVLHFIIPWEPGTSITL